MAEKSCAECPVRDLQCARVTSAVGDDEPLSLQIACQACFFCNWVVPRVETEFGQPGVVQAARAWEANGPTLAQDLKTGFVARCDTSSFKMLHLSMLKGTYAALAAPGDRIEMAKDMAQKWSAVKEGIARDKDRTHLF
jgi:hypothetical protein